MTWKRWVAASVPAWAVCVAVAGVLFSRVVHYPEHDPDLYYHVHISRLVAQHGVLHRVPQVAGLGWDRAFVDKEFLFHMLTGAGYAAANTQGLWAVMVLLTLAVLGALALLCVQAGGAWVALWVCPLVAVMTPDWLVRLMVLRPHQMGILFFVLLLAALLRRHAALAATSTMLFALAYHATFVPLVLLAVALVCGPMLDRAFRRTAWAGVVGIVLGTVLNPYFPDNVTMGILHMQLAWHQDPVTQADIGLESVPEGAPVFLRMFGAHLVVLVAAAWWLGRPRLNAAGQRVDAEGRFLLLAHAALWLMALRNPRASEYAVPVSAALACTCLHLAAPPRRTWLWLAGVVAAMQLARVRTVLWHGIPEPTEVQASLRAARALPADASVRVFNCEWHRSPFVLAERPQARVIDVLEPTLLLHHNAALFHARLALRQGRLADPTAWVTGLFGATHVLCQAPAAIAALDADPEMLRVHPRGPGPHHAKEPHVFAVLPAVTQQIRSMEVAGLGHRPAEQWLELTPELVPAAALSLLSTPVGTGAWASNAAVVDLSGIAAPAPPGTVRCALARVPAAAVATHAGAQLLVVGGGRSVRVWRNGQPLFATTTAVAFPTRSLATVPLEPALAPADTLEAVACSASPHAELGVALALWTRPDLEALCNAKTAARTMPVAGTTCLAPAALAAPRW